MTQFIDHSVRLGEQVVAGFLVREGGRDLGYVWPVYHAPNSQGRTTWGWMTPRGGAVGGVAKKQEAVDLLRDIARAQASSDQRSLFPQDDLARAARREWRESFRDEPKVKAQPQPQVIRGEGFVMTQTPPGVSKDRRSKAPAPAPVTDMDAGALRDGIRRALDKQGRE